LRKIRLPACAGRSGEHLPGAAQKSPFPNRFHSFAERREGDFNPQAGVNLT